MDLRATLRKDRFSTSPPGANGAALSSSDSLQHDLEHLIWHKDDMTDHARAK